MTRRVQVLHAALAALALLLAGLSSPAVAADAPSYDDRIAAAKASMMADSAAALTNARAAAKLAGHDDEARLIARWLEGEALLRLNRGDEAAELVAETLAETKRALPRSRLYADLLRSSGSIAAMSGDYGAALSAFLEAHERYEALGEKRSEAIVLQNIGSLYSDARDYERVLRYYRQAAEIFPEDAALSLSAHNNKGNALKELKRYEEAEDEFRTALALAEKMGSPLLEARILTNIASTQFLRGRLAAADETARQGLDIAGREAPQWTPFLLGVRAQIALERGDLRGSDAFLRAAFAGEKLGETSPYFRDFHQTGYETYRGLGDFRLAASHLAAFHRLDSQARDLSAKANNAILGARFDAADREVRIARLSAEATAKEAALAQATNRNVVLTTVIVFALLLVAIALFVLRNVQRNRAAIQAANEKLTYVTQHDSLTGLHSRDHFRELLERQIERQAAGETPGVLMLVDLDRFKQVNDIYGHGAGDKLLAEVGKRFRQAAGEASHIGRLGGDEFAIILPGAKDAEAAMPIARELIHEVSWPFDIDGFEMSVGASIGMSVIGVDGDNASEMMTNSDLALYEAKRRGRGMAVVYASHMRLKLEEKAQLEAELANALKNGELSVHYQPIVRGDDRSVIYYEALMRWTHPTRGEIPPEVFIPIAEDTLLIEELGSWMLKTACTQATRWDEKIRLSVNVSALQLANANFLLTVIDALTVSGLPANRLLLEVTESMLLEMDEELDRLLTQLNELGVCFALDDFGRGYSSLAYIEKIRFAMIKIDRSFVQSAATGSRRGEAIVSAIVSLANSLEIDVTAEGIEREEQIATMNQLGCACFQGFHLGLPGPHGPVAEDEGDDESSADTKRVA